MREGTKVTGPKRISQLKLRQRLRPCLKALELRAMGRGSLLRQMKPQLPTIGPETRSLLQGYPPLLPRKIKQTNFPVMTSIQNQNCPAGKKVIFPRVPTEEKSGRGNGTGTETETGIGIRKLTKRGNGLWIQISKDEGEGNTTPEEGATEELTAAVAGEVVVVAGLSTPTGSLDYAPTCPQLEALPPFATGRKARHAARARTLKSFQSADDGAVRTQTPKAKVGENLLATPDPLTASLVPNLVVH